MTTSDPHGRKPDPVEPATPLALVAEVLTFLPDLLVMLAGLVRDPRVPRVGKIQAAALLALGLSPVDLIPVLGEVGLVAALALATRQLIKHAGDDLVREHWQGGDRGFQVVLALADSGLRPGRLAWRALRGRG